MSLYDYRAAIELHAGDPPFYALIMAAIMKADTPNEFRLRVAFPHIWEEVHGRYNSPGGILASERENISCSPIDAAPDSV